MTSKPSQKILGRLEKVDLRAFWNEEGSEFTVWLAQADNMEMLGDTLGMELAIAPASQQDTSTNILCQDAQGNKVIIVSQLETTTPQCLGQILTKVANFPIPVVVWIAGDFTAEHQSTLTWLNQMTLPEFHFFGVEIELWRIGKSVAPKFNLVVQPAQTEDSTQPKGLLEQELEPEELEPEELEPEEELVEPLTEKQQQNLEFWSGLCHQLERRGSIVKPGDPVIESKMKFAIGRAGFRLYSCIDEELNAFNVGILLSGEDAKPHFYLLEEEQEAIEESVGIPLEWDAQGNATGDDKHCRIYCTLGDIDLTDRQRWRDYYQWFCLYLEQFHDVFGDRIKHLNANDYQPKPDYSFNPLETSGVLSGSSANEAESS